MARFRRALGFIGPMAAGKTEAAQYLERASAYSGLPVVIFNSSKYLSDLAKKMGVEDTREVKQALADYLEEENPVHIPIVLHDQIKKYESGVIIPVIDSIRSDEQAEEWIKRVPGMEFIYFQTNEDLRFVRYNDREIEHGRPALSREEFDDLHGAKCDNNIERLKKYVKPENIIDNNGDYTNLHSEAVRTLTNLAL